MEWPFGKEVYFYYMEENGEYINGEELRKGTWLKTHSEAV
jgi:hypothetical protein